MKNIQTIIQRPVVFKQAGFNLIEIMIASMLGIFITGGAISIHLANKNAFMTQESISYTQKNARFLINRFNKYISDAGYSGFFPGFVSHPVNNYLDLASDANSLLWDISKPVYGYDNLSTSSLLGMTDLAQNSDVLMLKKMSSVTNISSQTTNSLTLNGSSSVADASILIATDVNNAAIFQVGTVDTSVAGVSTATLYAGSNPSPGNTTLPVLNIFDSTAEVGQLETRLFLLKAGANGRNALFEGVLTTTTVAGQSPSVTLTEVIPNVEDLQFTYGVDTDGDGDVDRNSNASTVTNNSEWNKVRSVGVALLMSSDNSNIALEDNAYSFNAATFSYIYSTTSGDRRYRKPYVIYVTLKNI